MAFLVIDSLTIFHLLTFPDTFCCLELDSFGHFFMKAKTHIISRSREPQWNDVSCAEIRLKRDKDEGIIKAHTIHMFAKMSLSLFSLW